MTGEMSQSEVTPEAYPGMFALQRALRRRGIKSEPRAFDQYQGPYLSVPGVGKVWYADVLFSIGKDGRLRATDVFTIDNGIAPAFGGTFQTEGASEVVPETSESLAHGVYTLRQAAKRIAEVVR